MKVSYGIASLLLLAVAGCTPTPSAPVTTESTVATATTQATTTSSTPTMPTMSSASPSTSWTGEKAKIAETLHGYDALAAQLQNDPKMDPALAARYLDDVPPDYVLTAVQRNVQEYRKGGAKVSGSVVTKIEGIDNPTNGQAIAHLCADRRQVTVTNQAGEKADRGADFTASDMTLHQIGDGSWRIIKIVGKGARSSC